MTASPPATLSHRILVQLLRLRQAGGLALRPVEGTDGLHRFGFRAAGWPIVIDLDTTVLEVRIYHDRDVVAVGKVPEKAMDELLSPAPTAGAGAKGDPKSILSALRAVVADWKQSNARNYMRSPDVARHPDGWNGA